MNNKRGLSTGMAGWVCLFFVLCFPGCSQQNEQNNNGGYWEDAIRIEKALTCHNTNMGISFTIPKGWWIYDLNTANFSPDRDDTAGADSLDIIYGVNFTRIELVKFANFRFPRRKKYLGFDISAGSGGNFPVNGEFPEYDDGFISENNLNTSLIDSGFVTINNIPFEKQIYEVTQPRNKFRIITLSTGLKTGNFLNISIKYWLKYKNAEFFIIGLLDRSLTLE